MTLSQAETVRLFNLVLELAGQEAREALFLELKSMLRTEPEFYMGIIEHIPYLDYSSDQWFDFLSKIPNRIFRDEIRIMNKLSENQRKKLPPSVFEAT